MVCSASLAARLSSFLQPQSHRNQELVTSLVETYVLKQSFSILHITRISIMPLSTLDLISLAKVTGLTSSGIFAGSDTSYYRITDCSYC
jgi:hypothetical protein